MEISHCILHLVLLQVMFRFIILLASKIHSPVLCCKPGTEALPFPSYLVQKKKAKSFCSKAQLANGDTGPSNQAFSL